MGLGGWLRIVAVFLFLAAIFGSIAYFMYRRTLRRAKGVERGLKMVPLQIHLPPQSSDTQASGRDVREVMREKISQAQAIYDLLAGTATHGFKSNFYGQRHIAFEIIASNGVVRFYAAVPVALVESVQQAILAAYPGANLEEIEDYNIFSQAGKLAGTAGGELTLKADTAYPIATYSSLERDPLEAMLGGLSSLAADEGAGVQILIRPANPGWVKKAVAVAMKLRGGTPKELKFGAKDLVKAAVKTPSSSPATGQQAPASTPQLSNLELSAVEAIEEKTRHAGYETIIRILASSPTPSRTQQILTGITTGFALLDAPGLNGFKYNQAKDIEGLVTAYIFRFFPPEMNSNILNSVELATIFHLPDSQFTPTAAVERQTSKQVDGPVNVPHEGLLLGHNQFRGADKEIRLTPTDRRRHAYIVGQTGTGKSTLLENLAVQDMQNGAGFAFIDPHGDTAEKLISMVPKSRAEDVIYFNPGDTEHPLGLNLFEFSSPEQKDFIVQETINMLYRLYDPGHTGIIGPRYEHWYRNAALTLMADPNGSTFIEVPKVFTDSAYLKDKFKYLNDQTVIDFWTKEMAQTSDYHKSEMLGWFVSKFGAFLSNEIMRNIIGQTKSAFDFREVMDQKKILIVNLSKGKIGELNSQLLGMIFVIKFQAAAMSRASVLEEQRPDFTLYVDEFQNFSTDSFATILSEARKYRLSLIVANQFIGQLTDQIRDAVFGNVGTIVSYRSGPEDAEFLSKQFAPAFDARDIVNIPNFNSVVRLMLGGVPTSPFSMAAMPPLGQANPELGEAIKQLSAAKFGQTKAEVEVDISRRLSNTTQDPAAASTSTSQSAPTPAPQPKPVEAPKPAVAPDDTLNIKPIVKPTQNVSSLAGSTNVQDRGPIASQIPAQAGNDNKPVATVPAAVPVAPTPPPAPQVTQAQSAPAPQAVKPTLAPNPQPAPQPIKPPQQQPSSTPKEDMGIQINPDIKRAAEQPAVNPVRPAITPVSTAPAAPVQPAPAPQPTPVSVPQTSASPQPVPAPTPTLVSPQPAPVVASAAPQSPKPAVPAGEIMVDAQGNVIQG